MVNPIESRGHIMAFTFGGKLAFGALALAFGVAQPVQARLQCVPYARAHSRVALHGNAGGWWNQASGRYERGHAPVVGAVLAFRGTSHMPAGHVAVVSSVVDARHVLLDHANWSRPGAIEHGALAEDVSAAGDWSAVRVWHAPTHRLGLRTNPAFGFIYASRATTPSEAPWIEAQNVIWLDTRMAAQTPPEQPPARAHLIDGRNAVRLHADNVAFNEG